MCNMYESVHMILTHPCRWRTHSCDYDGAVWSITYVWHISLCCLMGWCLVWQSARFAYPCFHWNSNCCWAWPHLRQLSLMSIACDALDHCVYDEVMCSGVISMSIMGWQCPISSSVWCKGTEFLKL